LAFTENHATRHEKGIARRPVSADAITLNPNKIPAAQLAAYSALSVPLAMAALPIYVHVPKLYVNFGLSLGWIGAVLLALRALDAVIDPLLGKWSDIVASRKHFILFSLPLLAIGVFITFAPQLFSSGSGMSLIVGLGFTYVGFSAITIAYHAWGAQWARDVHERTRVTVWREGVGLIGVLVAAATPMFLTQQYGEANGYTIFSLAVCVALGVGAFITLKGAPQVYAKEKQTSPLNRSVMRDQRFRRLLIAYALNGIAAAVPATLFLFFIDDVVKANQWQALFLIAYFLAGALAAPLWLKLSHTLGKRRAWGLSMIVAIATFIWAAFLGAGDENAFVAICILSGIALGADLTIPPSMLADTIDANNANESSGAYFGVWTMVSKLNLALAAGIALPALSWWGYVPNAANAKTSALTLAYCVLPCVLKACALAALYFVKDETTNVEINC
jgi:glycoside/pentoside/hexuronide:cation symporter, GPH family